MGKTLRIIQVTHEERLAATRPNVYRNKTKYQRHSKFKPNYREDEE
jgi:hypothetical protein